MHWCIVRASASSVCLLLNGSQAAIDKCRRSLRESEFKWGSLQWTVDTSAHWFSLVSTLWMPNSSVAVHFGTSFSGFVDRRKRAYRSSSAAFVSARQQKCRGVNSISCHWIDCARRIIIIIIIVSRGRNNWKTINLTENVSSAERLARSRSTQFVIGALVLSIHIRWQSQLGKWSWHRQNVS